MALALRELGYSVHDFEEHLQYNLDNYLDYFEGRLGEEVFLEMYREVDVVVDQPACTLWNIIRGQFPDAKVILMERSDSRAWAKSYLGMLEYFRDHHKTWYLWMFPWLSKTHDKLERLTVHNMILSSASTNMHLKTSSVCQSLWEDQYNRHNAAVKAMVPSSNLLVYKVGDGWDKLCTFLGKDVPESEFPHENKGGVAGNITDQYVKFDVFQRGDREVMVSLGKMLITSVLVVGGCWCFKNGRIKWTC